MSASLSTSSPLSVFMCLLTIFHWGRWNLFLKIVPQLHKRRPADGVRILPAVRKPGLMKVWNRIMSRNYLLLWFREFWRSIRRWIPILACVISLSCKLGDWWYGVEIWSSEAKSDTPDYRSLNGYGSTFLAWIYLPSHGEWPSSYWRWEKILVCLSWLFPMLLDDLQWLVCSYKFQSSVGTYEDKTAVLSDADAVWSAVRHLHMREAIDKLMLDFNKFLEENAVFKG